MQFSRKYSWCVPLTLSIMTFQPALAETELSTIKVNAGSEDGTKNQAQKLLSVAGAGGDPLRAIEALPGVVLEDDGQGLPAVRGSSPESNNYITDHLPVGYLFHNDGNSTYHNLLIEDFDLKAGAWDAQYHDALGAVIETQLRDPYHEPLQTTLDLSFMRAGILTEGQVTENSAFYAAYRESLLPLYLEKGGDVTDGVAITQVPTNRDYQFKYHWRVNDTSNLKLVANGAKDQMKFEIGEDFDLTDNEPSIEGEFNQNGYFNSQGLLYDRLLENGSTLLIATSHLEEDLYFKVGSLFEIEATSDQYQFKTQLETPLNNGDQIRYGVELNEETIAYDVSGLYDPCNDEVETCDPASLGERYEDDDKEIIESYYAFVAYDWFVTPSWEVTAGLGNGYDNYLKQATYQPRISSRYRFHDQWVFTSSAGKHYQFPRNFFAVTERLGTPSLSLPNANHYVVGLEYELDLDIAIKVETYYKELNDIIISNPDFVSDELTPNEDYYTNNASGEAYGIEFLINKHLTDRWYGWLSVSYSKTKRTNDMTGEEFNFSYDRPWIINLVANYEVTDTITIGGKWRYQSGNLITPINGSTAIYECTSGGETEYTSTYDAATCNSDPYLYDPNEGKINSERLPANHRLDLRLDYKPTDSQKYYFEIVNAYNRQNVSEYEYNEDYTEKEKVVGLGSLFNLGATFVF